MNIITGQIAHPVVNADNAVSLGQRATSNLKAGWPGSFYSPLGKLVVTMDLKKKHVFVGKERVYDQTLIDARVIGLLASSREINFGHLLAYELVAYPPPMFNPCGEMKITKSKSTTKLKLQVVISEGNCSVFGSSLGRLTNSRCMWMPYCSLIITLFKSQMSLSYLTDTSPTADKTSRRCRDGSSWMHKLTSDMPAPAK